ncbi:DNA cross-link repair protein pso2/snm1 [Westerdykella ornata]|uniref:DNA cross-link repair protein pso2/snm1 n=1 Tax=Westerdykella ornata TaxID=318751 RepID=A0A6A6JQ16_WESOR|nr:DNA cross-link repair protein pso2/snm1 [Westerdykella ornata]KAF2278223.1 DNA cross-link repair protein pso2/snm1 [Westerdykella ornata]
MFRNPRENRTLPPTSQLPPSVGRPPSPPRFNSTINIATAMPAQNSRTMATPKPRRTSSQARQTQTTLVPSSWGKKSVNGGTKAKPKAAPNGNIMAFFKKAEEQNNRIFLQERGTNAGLAEPDAEEPDIGWADSLDVIEADGVGAGSDDRRYNEYGGSFKRRRVTEEALPEECSPPPPQESYRPGSTTPAIHLKEVKKTGPFIDDSDSETEDVVSNTERGIERCQPPSVRSRNSNLSPLKSTMANSTETTVREPPRSFHAPPSLKTEDTSVPEEENNLDDYEGVDDDDFQEGEENEERHWMEEQRRLEMAEEGVPEEFMDLEVPFMFPGTENGNELATELPTEEVPSCPICNAPLDALGEQQRLVHVNACLDGNSIAASDSTNSAEATSKPWSNGRNIFRPTPRPAREGQANPFQLGEFNEADKSAFSKLMANNAEDSAWATAAVAERTARGKPSYQRTCPFYKILPGFYICVDAFRYGAVKGQNAYFLSHFHSDHYIGLTSSWSHGPIYCSKVTGNLVRQQLRVDPKWVVDLEFEQKTEVPNTEGVFVTMIPANHCPGSSLFLFEKEVGKVQNPRLQRVLHCGDFRACKAHVEHPLLRPDVLDTVSGKTRQQKLDVCYLDTTYLNPKYAFPPQEQVIQACADMCVSLNTATADENDGWEKMKRERAGQGMVNFIQREREQLAGADPDAMAINGQDGPKDSGRLLVIVGTYSIGKERMCVGIAKALKSKIYAPPNKQKICLALEDPELNALLTTDPRDAQVHMTPLFEIRAETLDDYLRDYRDHFSRAVGFRPSGWNYRPPNSRFTENPSVQTVLHSKNWKTQFTMRDLTPQRGSTSRASCFGVPYSEHSSFRELTMFCCALRIDKIIPTVNVGNAKARERMKAWCDKWALEKKKNGLFRLWEDGSSW